MRQLTIPAPVRPGAHIRIVSPAMPSAATLPERARRGEEALRKLGFITSYGRHALDVTGALDETISARNRAHDLVEAYEDPDVAAVLSADAGESTEQVLELLDPAVFTANPKPFIGYCDNVSLNLFLATAGVSSLYGCTLMGQLGEPGGAFPETGSYLLRALDSSEPLDCRPVSSRTGEFLNWYLADPADRLRRRCIPGGWTWLRPGTARGPLIGGELRLIPHLVRRFELSLDSVVLFWHLAFRGPDPEATFHALASAVDITRLAGMIVGAHPTIQPPEWAARVSDMVEELLPETSYPIIANADISHLDPAWTVPYAEEVWLSSDEGMIFPRGPGDARQNCG